MEHTSLQSDYIALRLKNQCFTGCVEDEKDNFLMGNVKTDEDVYILIWQEMEQKRRVLPVWEVPAYSFCTSGKDSNLHSFTKTGRFYPVCVLKVAFGALYIFFGRKNAKLYDKGEKIQIVRKIRKMYNKDTR